MPFKRWVKHFISHKPLFLLMLGAIVHFSAHAQLREKSNSHDYGGKELPKGLNPDRVGMMLDQLKESGSITEEQYKQAEKEIRAVSPEQWKQINGLSIQMNATQGSGQAVDLKQNRQAEQVQEQVKKILGGKNTTAVTPSAPEPAAAPSTTVRGPASIVAPTQTKAIELAPEAPKDPNEIDPSIFSIIRRE